MKKIFRITLLIAAVAFVITSCSTTKSTTASGTAGASKGKFTGKWVLGSITYDGLVEGAVQNVFDQARPSAFRGSTWNLTNSGNGMYTLNDGTSQTIYWSVNNSGTEQIFQFKKIYQGDKPKNVADGYQLYVVSATGDAMTLRSPIAVGNKTAYIIYDFTRTK